MRRSKGATGATGVPGTGVGGTGAAVAPTPVRSPGRAIARLAKHLENGLAPLDVSVSQYRVLALLAEGSAASSALAGRLAVSPPSLTAVVDGLVARDLVTRTPDPADRRRLTLELTPAGRALLLEADAAANERLDSIAEFVGADDPGELVASLERWHDALDAFREEKRREARARQSGP
jgi:long-chain acyl-CoA synthetase